MKDLYTNRSSRQDYIINGIIHNTHENMDIFIASAFFTESNIIENLVGKGCHIRIIVRLGFPTSPSALENLLKHNNVEARFFTSNEFHPKLYIFGDEALLVGSANLTTSALNTNQEIMISITSEDHRFDELRSLFSDYWDEAEVLNKDIVKKYQNIYNKHSEANRILTKMHINILDVLGDKNFSNINRDKKKKNKKSIFLEVYQKSYQTSVYAFRCIEEIYKNFNRKVDESLIPLRLEIDSFFSFVRDHHATQDAWKHQSNEWTDCQKSHLEALINEWLRKHWEHFEDRIVPINYPLISCVFNSPESIRASSIEEIVEALCVLHSFHDRLRFYKGGLETLKIEFINSNDVNKVRKTFIHLLHGRGEIVTRMSDCIYEEEYKLNEFGQANVQELIGWINKENLPVINGRTTKILRYFGHDVRQL